MLNPLQWNPWIQLTGVFLLHLAALSAYKLFTQSANLSTGLAAASLALGAGFCLVSDRSSPFGRTSKGKPFVPALCYVLFISSLSHQSLKGVEMVIPGDFFHPLEYAVLAVFLSWGWMHVLPAQSREGTAGRSGFLPRTVSSIHGRIRESVFGVTLLSGGLFGVLDEWHQSWIPGRFSSGFDVLLDAFGLVLGSALVRWLASRSPGWASLRNRGFRP